jgi:predicted Zn finger-like uncharacterized protein
MIIQCGQCRAKFRLDDSRVAEKGVKVRCARCKHLFIVTREQPVGETPDFSSSLDQTGTSPQEEVPFSAPPLQQSEAQELSTPFSLVADLQEETSDGTVTVEPNLCETKSSDSTFEPPVNDEFALSSPEDDEGFVFENDEVPSTGGEVDFDTFDFGDSVANLDESLIQPSPAQGVEKKEEAVGCNFSDDDMFWAETSPPAEESTDSDSFEFNAESFADSMEIGAKEEIEKETEGEKKYSLVLDSDADEPFGPGDMDFSDETDHVAPEQGDQDELKPYPEILFTPLPADIHEKPEPDPEDGQKIIVLPSAGETAQEELPPLAITSRRKQNQPYTGLIVAAALLVVGALGYLGFTVFSADKGKVTQEVGKISVRSVKAYYVKNVSAGPLLVISGEAVNEYPVARAALQVKGMIFGDKGQILASKSAFGGNMLTGQQVESLPLEKIEAAMANQFGDSLVNLEVAPGKGISFMIVITAPSKDGKDFGVEPIGSTVATAKQ